MSYTVNPSAFSSVFTVPSSVVDEHIKLCTQTQLKVLLCVFKNLSQGINPETISNTISVSVNEVNDALLYWSQAGILNREDAVKPIAESKPVVIKSQKPTRADVAKRGLEDPKVKFLMLEAQQRFGRILKSNEQSTLLWLYDDQGLDISVILLLLQYAVSENALNMRFIEKTAAAWIEKGVSTAFDAEKQIAETAVRKTAWRVVEKAFGIERRQPSDKELELSELWLNQWGFTPELLKCAYDACVNSKSKLSIPYIAKILESWHKQGVKTPLDIDKQKAQKSSTKTNDFAAYDIDAFEKSLYSDD